MPTGIDYSNGGARGVVSLGIRYGRDRDAFGPFKCQRRLAPSSVSVGWLTMSALMALWAEKSANAQNDSGNLTEFSSIQTARGGRVVQQGQ